MGKKKEYDPKTEGQQYEEVQARQRQNRQEGDYDISIEKSKQKDREELEQLGNEATRRSSAKAGSWDTRKPHELKGYYMADLRELERKYKQADRALYHKGDPATAVKLLEELVTSEPREPLFRWSLGYASHNEELSTCDQGTQAGPQARPKESCRVGLLGESLYGFREVETCGSGDSGEADGEEESPALSLSCTRHDGNGAGLP